MRGKLYSKIRYILVLFLFVFFVSCGVKTPTNSNEGNVKTPTNSNEGNVKTPTNSNEGNEKTPIVVCEHIESDWVIDKEPTAYLDGSKHTECINCGEIILEDIIPKFKYSVLTIKTLLQKSIVKVYCYDYEKENIVSQGTGFFINSSGAFITNAHVVKDAYYIKIKTYLGAVHDVTSLIKYNYISSDYAILRANGCISTPVKFNENCENNDTVYAIGFPNDSIILNATEGKIINKKCEVDANKTVIENTAEIDHGSSGGVLVNTDGEVLGITTGLLENNNFAAVKYTDFKNELSGVLIGTKEPLEWFHNKEKIYLYNSNFEEYFDVLVDGQVVTDTYVSYDIKIKLKDKYKNKKVSLGTTGLSIFFEVRTYFEWYEKGNYFDAYKYEKKSNYLDIKFYDVDDLFTGKTSYCYSKVYIYTTQYHSMEITYDIYFSSIIGDLYTID